MFSCFFINGKHPLNAAHGSAAPVRLAFSPQYRFQPAQVWWSDSVSSRPPEPINNRTAELSRSSGKIQLAVF